MYAEHVPVINAAMRSDLECFKRGILFAILSARMPITSVPEQLREVEEHGISAPSLFGWKADTYRWLETGDNARKLQQILCATSNPETAIHALLRVPGLGIVKEIG